MAPINPSGAHPASRLMYGVLSDGSNAPIQLDANGLIKIAADVIVGDLINVGINDTEFDGNTGTVSAQTLRVTLATDVPLPTGTNSIGNVGVEPTNSGSAVEGWGNGAAAAKALTGSYVVSDGGAVATGGKSNWIADFNLSAVGDTPITSFEIDVQVSIDGSNYRTIQTKTIAAGTITLADGEFTKATGGVAVTGTFDFDTKGASNFRLRAKSTGGDPTNSALYIQVRGAGV
ncbi:MAG: hypothetical protein GWN00_07545 [Aliifodinibius sp.]|nr:hypothetical protein [Fodinibius sp.]NIW44240.1 hypothetical protein [Gammaproteobacteria bacterium]NIX55397.1 hypothetical protein [candidate division Zixibacteria bacterium]NIY24666.1 hypothetical protein [Fodinibius sp.]